MEYRKSRQRDQIFKILERTETHPTANWIYDQLKGVNPSLSLGTVYRNLGILVEQGLVSKLNYGSTFDRYEVKKRDHYHFICENCGRILDLDMPIKDNLNSEVDRLSGFTTRKHQINFFGICPFCD